MTTRGKKNERGVTAAEYGLIIGVLGLVAVVALPTIGSVIAAWFNDCVFAFLDYGFWPASC